MASNCDENVIFVVTLVTRICENNERHWLGSEVLQMLFISHAKF
jgi:hypothetical protein